MIGLANSRRGTVLAACAIALPVALALALLAAGAPARLELESVGTRFEIRGRASPPKRIVLVAIDRQTLTALDTTWPLPRQLHARAIDRLAAAGAREIAYDVEFPGAGRTRAERRASATVAAAAGRAGNVVFAAFAPNAAGQTNVLGRTRGAHPPAAGFSGFKTENGLPVSKVPVSVSGLRSLSAEIAAAGRSSDPASTCRRVRRGSTSPAPRERSR